MYQENACVIYLQYNKMNRADLIRFPRVQASKRILFKPQIDGVKRKP